MLRHEGGRMRPGWQATVRSDGITYLDNADPGEEFKSYWGEGKHYELTESEIKVLTEAAKTLSVSSAYTDEFLK